MDKAGALWLKDGNVGKFFSGQIEIDGKKRSILVFKNTTKQEGSKQPDYQIYWGKDTPPKSSKGDPPPRTTGDDSEVPF